MTTLQIFFRLIITGLLVAAGILVLLFPVPDLFNQFEEFKQNVPYRTTMREVGGGAFAVIALLAFLPLWPKSRKGKTISFQGTHGDVTIELDPVESTMERVVGKLPEVKNCSIRLKPNKDRSGVEALATAVLLKDANADARQITARVNSYIQAHTRKILGVPDVTVNLKVNRFVVNMKSVKPEPLMLEGPEEEEEYEPEHRLQPHVSAAATVAGASTQRTAAHLEDEEEDLLDQTVPQPGESGSLEGRVPESPASRMAEEQLSDAARAMEALDEEDPYAAGSDFEEEEPGGDEEEEGDFPEAVVEEDDESTEESEESDTETDERPPYA